MIYLIEPLEESSMAMNQARTGDRITLLYTSPDEQSIAYSRSRALQRRAVEMRKNLTITIERRRVDK